MNDTTILTRPPFDEKEMAQCCLAAGLMVDFRNGHRDDWDMVLEKANYVPTGYSNFSVEYQLAYQIGHGGVWNDFSLIIEWGSRKAAVWPLTISTRDGISSISSQGNPLLPPLFAAEISSSSRAKITRICFDLLARLRDSTGIRHLEICDEFLDEDSLSIWHVEAMERKSKCEFRHDLFLKTSTGLDNVLGNFSTHLRRKFRKGLEMWSIQMLGSGSEDIDSIFAEFKNLHLEVSGRKTRSDESWDIQRKYIGQNQAFLSYLRDERNTMIGCGLFTVTKDEGNYAVGAYDRKLFGHPVAHVIQLEAIKEFINRKIRWYKIGGVPYSSDIPSPTEKELSIAYFKKQFSSHVLPRFNFVLPIGGANNEDNDE